MRKGRMEIIQRVSDNKNEKLHAVLFYYKIGQNECPDKFEVLIDSGELVPLQFNKQIL
jgi:hypothetical protein